MEYIKLKKISLKDHPQINEKWVQQKIVEDPSILGLGEIELKDMERKQPRAGRLDFLFQDLKKQEEIQIEAVQYVYDKEFAKQWKDYYFNLMKRELHQLMEDVVQHEENGDICS